MTEKERYQLACSAHVANPSRIRKAVFETVEAKDARAIRLPKKKWMIVLFAAILLIAVSAVAGAAWLTKENFSVERYLMQSEAERKGDSRIADIETMIRDASIHDLGYTIRLLPELPDAERYASFRADNGAKPFSEAEWSWLKEIRPETVDVILDGEELIVQTRLYTPHAKSFYAETDDGIALDCDSEDGYYEAEGDPTQRMLSSDGWGVPPMSSTEAYALSFSSYTIDETFPKEGTVTVCQRLHVLDSNVDDMSVNATVAVIEHRFSFRAEAFADIAEPEHTSLNLKGSAILTVRDWKGWTISNHCVDLSGIRLDAELDYRKTGLCVKVTMPETGNLSDPEKQSFLDAAHLDIYGNYDSGLILRYTIGKATYAAPVNINQNSAFVVPVFPSDYGKIESIRFSLSLAHLTECNGQVIEDGWSQDLSTSIESKKAEETVLACWTVALPKL